MNISNGSLDCLPYLDAAQSITQQIEDITFISVISASLSGDIAKRKSQSNELCRAAMVSHLQLHGINCKSDCDITVEKSIWGKPNISLSETIERQVKEESIERLLVSTTNDCDILLCIAAAVQSNKIITSTSLGIGVDLLCHSTSKDLFSDCSSEELSQMFFTSEIKSASKIKDPFYLPKLVSIKEAVFKSISEAFHNIAFCSFSHDEIQTASFLDVAIVEITDESIATQLHGQLAEIAKASGVQLVLVRLISGNDYVGAVAVSMGQLLAQ